MKNRNKELCKYCIECNKPCPYGFFNDDICNLTEEQCKKRNFVQSKLEPLMKGLHIGIISVKYSVENGEEIITTRYHDGGEMHAIVTADSLPALCRDTLKGV